MVQKLLVGAGELLLQLPVPEPCCGRRDQRHRHPDPAARSGRSCHPEPCLSTPGHWNSPQMGLQPPDRSSQSGHALWRSMFRKEEFTPKKRKGIGLRSLACHIKTETYVYQSARAVITKHPRLGGSNNRHYFSRFRRLGSSRSRCWLIQFLVRPLFLAYRQLPSCCVLRQQKESSSS